MRVPKIQETCDEELKCTENQEPNEEEQTRSNIQESEDEESICRLDRERQRGTRCQSEADSRGTLQKTEEVSHGKRTDGSQGAETDAHRPDRADN